MVINKYNIYAIGSKIALANYLKPTSIFFLTRRTNTDQTHKKQLKGSNLLFLLQNLLSRIICRSTQRTCVYPFGYVTPHQQVECKKKGTKKRSYAVALRTSEGFPKKKQLRSTAKTTKFLSITMSNELVFKAPCI